jgi:hypothetical protein
VLTSLQALQRLATLKWLGVFIFALATLLTVANTASALEPAQTKTRVWDFDFAEHNSAGLFRAASSGKHQGNRLAGAEEASGSLLAAEGVGRHGDFHGPWRPLPDPDIKWGDYLRRMTGTEPPVGMRRPHAHHSVFKEGLPGRQRELVAEAQDLLKRRAGVDPIWDVRNLGWAPNKAHTTAVMEDIVTRLRALDAANGTPSQFESLLRQFSKEAAAR